MSHRGLRRTIRIILLALALPTEPASAQVTVYDNFGAGHGGFLCATGSIVRGGVVFPSANLATYNWDLGTHPGMSGVLKHFQYWFRDSNPEPTSNFTSALQVRFGS